MPSRTLSVNRAPVLTLWAAVVAERLGHPHDAALTLGKAVPTRQLEHVAFALYEAFRPRIPEGVRGWGAKGVPDLDRIRRLADRH